MKFKMRENVLVIAAAVITGLCWWRMTVTPSSKSVPTKITQQSPAPAFELYDQQSRRVSLEAYLHRHKIMLVFFDQSDGPDTNKTLLRLRDIYPALKKNGVMAIAVGNLLPQQVRERSTSNFPFPILADITAGQTNSASSLWGRTLKATGANQPLTPPGQPAAIEPASFFIDRAGLVEWEGQYPRPAYDSDSLINQLLTGKL